MQSCLEKRGIEERHEEIVRNDYTRDNQYSSTHPNALATGDEKGKGTGHGGHTYFLPNCNGPMGVFDYSNFDTNPASGAGGKTDNETRKVAMARSVFNAENAYSAKIVDTTKNVREGQYVMK